MSGSLSRFALKISGTRTRVLAIRDDHIGWVREIPKENSAPYIREKLTQYLADGSIHVGVVDGLVMDLMIELYNALPEIFYMCSPNGEVKSVNGFRVNIQGHDELEQAALRLYEDPKSIEECTLAIADLKAVLCELLESEDNPQIRTMISYYIEFVERLFTSLEEGEKNYQGFIRLLDRENCIFEHCLGWVDSQLLHLQVTNPLQQTNQIMSALISQARQMGIHTLMRIESKTGWLEQLGLEPETSEA